MRRAVVILLLAGCSVADDPYPARWDPLPPALYSDCRHFGGTYADRGESAGQTSKPSLTRELFGKDSPWEKAESIRIDVPGDDALDIAVSAPGAKPFSRRLTTKAGDFFCDRGRLTVHSTRWVASDLMSGREKVSIEMHRGERHLLARVNENTTGVMFLVVPLSGESAKWYRFPRLNP